MEAFGLRPTKDNAQEQAVELESLASPAATFMIILPRYRGGQRQSSRLRVRNVIKDLGPVICQTSYTAASEFIDLCIFL